ncbi:hypothetical protein BDV32DRAFT_46487 [Aspergillus pseudonomiae]|uniref:Uncharacterized protein n=1 Tax=Aspergillus pseudonomiae TaxID=1506151 RepID=A0A5N6I3C7_9EURO|nr:uncharacterized protein BDV37DRAFT_147920 [Aspergillus pseudonomiae]KAB8260644.1 hypothetical protein BDV32DRAFT_46487 [Aspergillus pseudonomiae]KAE8403068.1 hypothetical protein BDV37DRAFT_147920 [Aspergillus pseudonomiae]
MVINQQKSAQSVQLISPVHPTEPSKILRNSQATKRNSKRTACQLASSSTNPAPALIMSSTRQPAIKQSPRLRESIIVRKPRQS